MPNGLLARDLDISGQMTNDTTEPIVSTQRCRKCGITLRNAERGCSVCDRARNSPESGQSLSRAKENVTEKSSAQVEKVAGVSEKMWTCDACREENPAVASSCRTCFKSRPVVKEKQQSSRQPAQEETAKRSRGNKTQAESDSRQGRPTESQAASVAKQSGDSEETSKGGASVESRNNESGSNASDASSSSASASGKKTGFSVSNAVLLLTFYP